MVERIRALHAEKLSPQKIAGALNAEKAPMPTGATWSKMAVKAVLDRAGGER